MFVFFIYTLTGCMNENDFSSHELIDAEEMASLNSEQLFYDEEEELHLLNENLKQLCSEYESIQPKSSNFHFKKWFKFAITLLSDVVSGAVSFVASGGNPSIAVTTGAVCSGATYLVMDAVEQNTAYHGANHVSQCLNQVVINTGSTGLNINDSIGYMHNYIIYYALQDSVKRSVLASVATDSITVSRINTIVPGYSLLVNHYQTGNITSVYGTLDHFIDSAPIAYSYEEYTDSVCLQNVINSSELQTYIDYVDKIARMESNSTILSFTQNVIQLVSNSNLSNTTKIRIISCIIIGYASSQLWDKNGWIDDDNQTE